MDDKTIQVTAYLLESLHAKLKQLADSEHRSVSNMIVIAVDQFVRGRLPPAAFPPGHTRRQVDITEAIAEAVKRGPVKSPKHK